MHPYKECSRTGSCGSLLNAPDASRSDHQRVQLADEPAMDANLDLYNGCMHMYIRTGEHAHMHFLQDGHGTLFMASKEDALSSKECAPISNARNGHNDGVRSYL